MKLQMIAVLGCALMLLTARPAVAGESFDTASVRGRYTGHLDLGANLTDGTQSFRLDIQLLSALTFDGKGAVEGSSRVTLTIPGQAPFTCPFATTGSYQIDADGLGTATLVLATAAGQTCGDGGGVTLQVSLAVGGHNRRRLDIAINTAVDSQSEALPIVGTGTLEK